MGKIHPQRSELILSGLILYIFSHGLLTHDMTDIINRSNHGKMHGVGKSVADKAAVDLQIVHRQIPQGCIGRQTTTEIIQCKATTLLAQFVHEPLGNTQIRNRGGFDNFKTDALCWTRAALNLCYDKALKILVADRLGGQINIEMIIAGFCLRVEIDPFKDIRDDPLIYPGGQAIAFCGG